MTESDFLKILLTLAEKLDSIERRLADVEKKAHDQVIPVEARPLERDEAVDILRKLYERDFVYAPYTVTC